ncbi:MAG: hypothetical protein RBU25_04595, partial [Lentisphaeria bacterium]|nr:hypothetical protein [Lentisphaeria bacterium]
MNRTILCLALLAASLPAADFHVAPAGSDTAGGTADAPFATVARAREAVRELRQREPERNTPVEVEIRGGLYLFGEPIRFQPEDSGRADSETVYRARPGETPVFSGGVRLTGWQVRDGRWELVIPEVRDGNWRFSQLFVDGQRRFRPRLPKQGYHYVAAPLANEGTGSRPGNNRFRYRKGDLDPNWYSLNDVELLIFHNWSMSRLPVAAIDTERRAVTLAGFTWHPDMAVLDHNRNYLVENVREALSEPGEWYLDRASGLLTYLPMPGETPARSEVVAPRIDYLVGFEGDRDSDSTVGHIRLQGLVFEHTNWNVPADGYCVPQSDISGQGTGGESPFPVA